MSDDDLDVDMGDDESDSSGFGWAFGGSALASGVEAHFNRKENDKQRRWNESMAGTAYRRAAHDLEKAGLNRILALGSPATTPSGSHAAISRPNAIETGIAAASARQQIKQSRAQEALLNAQREVALEQRKLIHEQGRSAESQADKDSITKALYSASEPFISGAVDKAREGLASGAKAWESWKKNFLPNLYGDWGFSDAPEEYRGYSSEWDPESKSYQLKKR